MTTADIASRLVAFCKEAKYEQAQRELYSADAESIEPEGSPGLQSVKGLEQIIEKGDQFQSIVEAWHRNDVSEPLVAGDFIALTITLELTMKGRGRQTLNELAVYEVKNGKIVKEQFFYNAGA